MNHFLNPYGFVSIPDREKLPAELRDDAPPGHDRYHRDRWTGAIPITITTRTPLLLPDHAGAAASSPNGTAPPPLPVKVDHEGRPMLSPTAVKGMLRSAYEAVTNSRFGVFTGHDTQLAIRSGATRDVAERLRPGIVTARDKKAGTATIRWVDALRPTDAPHHVPQAAVWVHTAQLGDHGDGSRLEAWIHLVRHSRGFVIWRASAIGPCGTLPVESPGARLTASMTDLACAPVRVVGVLHRTGSTFPAGGIRKHDERLVVEEVLSGPAQVVFGVGDVGAAGIAAWEAVIDSFVTAHDTESEEHRRRKYGSYVHSPDRWRGLDVGRTLHVELGEPVRSGGPKSIVGMYPAMIGRKPFPGTPKDSLPEKHRPALSRGDLSPADRVFGWVRAGADEAGTAYRGHLRVCPDPAGRQPTGKAIRDFTTPLRLTTLNSPKPAQFLFYLADQDGRPLEGKQKTPENGFPATGGKAAGRRLRGRKVYLTHSEVLEGMDGAQVYWAPAADNARPVTVDGRTRFREYAAPSDAKANVATSINGWVEPGTTFSLELRVDNLSTVELGALLWLLDVPDGAVHKLGLGKPLGFGAVRVDVDWERVRLFTGPQLDNRYRAAARSPEPTPAAQARATVDAYLGLASDELEQVRGEFLAAAKGYPGLPVHYPRTHTPGEPGMPPPQAESYKWWVANDQVGSGPRHALPALGGDRPPELPYLAERERSSSSGPVRRPRPDRGRR